MREYIWLVGYVKSGNNWMSDLLCHGIYGSTYESSQRRDCVPLFTESVHNLMGKDISTFRTELPFSKKTHLTGINGRLPGKVVYVVRNPLDVMCSFYNHQQLTGRADAYEGFDNYIDLCLSLKGMPRHDDLNSRWGCGRWSNHVSSWLDQKDLLILLVRYEDLLEDTFSELKKIYEFLNLDLEDDYIKEGVEKFSFKVVKEKQEKIIQEKGSDVTFKDLFDRTPPDLDALKKGFRFVNKGQAGWYKEKLSPGQISRAEIVFGEAMKRLDYL